MTSGEFENRAGGADPKKSPRATEGRPVGPDLPRPDARSRKRTPAAVYLRRSESEIAAAAFVEDFLNPRAIKTLTSENQTEQEARLEQARIRITNLIEIFPEATSVITRKLFNGIASTPRAELLLPSRLLLTTVLAAAHDTGHAVDPRYLEERYLDAINQNHAKPNPANIAALLEVGIENASYFPAQQRALRAVFAASEPLIAANPGLQDRFEELRTKYKEAIIADFRTKRKNNPRTKNLVLKNIIMALVLEMRLNHYDDYHNEEYAYELNTRLKLEEPNNITAKKVNAMAKELIRLDYLEAGSARGAMMLDGTRKLKEIISSNPQVLAGRTHAEIMELIPGLPEGGVSKAMVRAGLRRRTYTRMSKEEISQIIAELNSGETYDDIASKHGRHKETIKRIANRRTRGKKA